MTLQIMEEEVKISRERVHRILVDDMRKLMICARFLLHCLTEERRPSDCKLVKSLFSLDDSRPLLEPVVKGDETWCFHCDLKTKRQHGMVLTKHVNTHKYLFQK
jgi:hypothetical protein